MVEDGIDIGAARPKLLDEERAAQADRIITMGCDVEGVPRIDDDWASPIRRGSLSSASAKSATWSEKKPSDSPQSSSRTDRTALAGI